MDTIKYCPAPELIPGRICGRKAGPNGYCPLHKRFAMTCTWPLPTGGECGKKIERYGMCDDRHYVSRGEDTDSVVYGRLPQGTLRMTSHGYAEVKVGSRYVREHRIVMEELLGRPLVLHENVHHMNGVRHDNRPGNLELWSVSHPKGQRVQDKLRWAVELIETHYPGILGGDVVERLAGK